MYGNELERLRIENKNLRVQLEKTREELDEYKRMNLQKSQRLAASKEKREQWTYTLKRLTIQDPSKLFKLRERPVMNGIESKMLKMILEEVKQDDYKEKYKYIYVYPQVSLHSIFERTNIGKMYDEEMKEAILLKQFLSKSVDFLLCKKISSGRGDIYEPILAIEIDGKYHMEQEQRERDEIKNALFDAVNIPLLRHVLTDDEKDERDIKEEIGQMLL